MSDPNTPTPTPTPNRGRWQKGQSGNPSGKAKFERTLADVLREIGDRPLEEHVTYKRMLAYSIWHAATFGEADLIGGKHIDLDTKDWLALVKWLNVHVDGHLYVQRTINDDLPDLPDFPDLPPDTEPQPPAIDALPTPTLAPENPDIT